MFAIRDFAPRSLSPPSWQSGAGEWESLAEAVAAANEWVRAEGVDVVNIETVVLPCHVDTPAFTQTDAPAAFVNGQHWHVCRQFIRVWYQAADAPQGRR